MGEAPPISAYLTRTFFERVDEIHFASVLRARNEPGKLMMSGSEKRLKRNGSTASCESGPPSWNRTTAMFFVSAIPTLYAIRCHKDAHGSYENSGVAIWNARGACEGAPWRPGERSGNPA